MIKNHIVVICSVKLYLIEFIIFIKCFIDSLMFKKYPKWECYTKISTVTIMYVDVYGYWDFCFLAMILGAFES